MPLLHCGHRFRHILTYGVEYSPSNVTSCQVALSKHLFLMVCLTVCTASYLPPFHSTSHLYLSVLWHSAPSQKLAHSISISSHILTLRFLSQLSILKLFFSFFLLEVIIIDYFPAVVHWKMRTVSLFFFLLENPLRFPDFLNLQIFLLMVDIRIMLFHHLPKPAKIKRSITPWESVGQQVSTCRCLHIFI